MSDSTEQDKATFVRLPASTREKLTEMAKLRGRSMSYLIRLAVDQYLAKRAAKQ